MSIDGNLNLDDPNSSASSQAPFTLPATALLAPPMLGDSFLPEYALESSLEPPLALPLLDLNATGYAGNVADGDLTLPLLDLAGGIDDQRLLPTYTLQACAKNGAIAITDLTLPALTLAATGYAGVIGDGAIVLPLPDAAGVMEPQSNLTMATCTPSATAVARNIAAGAATLPRYALAAPPVPGQHGGGRLRAAAAAPERHNGVGHLRRGRSDARACLATARCSRCGAGSISRR